MRTLSLLLILLSSAGANAAPDLPKRPEGITDADEVQVRQASERHDGTFDYSRIDNPPPPPVGFAYELGGGLGFMSLPAMELPADASDPTGIVAHAGLGARLGSHVRVLAVALYLDAQDDTNNGLMFPHEVGGFGVVQFTPSADANWGLAAGLGAMHRGDWARAGLARAYFGGHGMELGVQYEASAHDTSCWSFYAALRSD